MLHRLVWELRLAFTALQFFTRVPVPAWVGWSPEQQRASARYLPAVGCLVGAVAAGVYALARLGWPPGVAVLLSMGASLWLTGAFHEDGLADCCDGFGGGGTDRTRVLAIMKDSRVGSFGVVGLVLVLGLKFQLLLAVPAPLFWAVSIGSHAMSRWSALWVMVRLPYLREDGPAKSRAMAQGLSSGALLWGLVWGLLPLSHWGISGVWAALGAFAVAQAAVYWLRARLGGYVGDTLGAAQQCAEVAMLLICVASLPALSTL